MQRFILHLDMNSFYAAVECMYRPDLRHAPLAVGGDAEKRHGIILAKNEYAKRYGVKTGEALWQARQKCPELVFVPPDFPLYLRYSQMARKIYQSYTPKVESFGLDECWLDISSREMNFTKASQIAVEISDRIVEELGVTVSVGVSWNKVFAKLGSDLNKPDGICVISPENYKDRVWPLAVEELLYVGSATKRKFHHAGIFTIGDLARCKREYLSATLGKVGIMLSHFARGEDQSEVSSINTEEIVKSVGNSVTTPRDIVGEEDVRLIFYALVESVAARLREQGFVSSCVSISLRDTDLYSSSWQSSFAEASDRTLDLFEEAWKLYQKHYPDKKRPLRSIGIRAEKISKKDPEQLAFFPDQVLKEQYTRIDTAIDTLRARFGYLSVRRAYLLRDNLGRIDAKGSHTISPISFLKGGEKIC